MAAESNVALPQGVSENITAVEPGWKYRLQGMGRWVVRGRDVVVKDLPRVHTASTEYGILEIE